MNKTQVSDQMGDPVCIETVSGHSWLTLNGAWDDDFGQVNDARRGLENVMDGLLCELPDGPTQGPPLEG